MERVLRLLATACASLDDSLSFTLLHLHLLDLSLHRV
jgi:hypothetical protein